MIYKFKDQFSRQPLFFRPNHDCSIFMVASVEDGRYINLNKKQEFEFSRNVQGSVLDVIREIIYDEEEQQFIILANKFREKLGFFILTIQELDPKKVRFIVKWGNKLDIGDTSMAINRDKSTGVKELVVSFKTIYINTYNVLVMDITVPNVPSMIFRHESF